MRSTTHDTTISVPAASARSKGRFATDVGRRLREADGTSHTRALAYQTVFIMLSGFIGIVGLASVLGLAEVRRTVQHLATSIAPGPSGRLLQEAAQQGASGGAVVAILGLGAAWISGMFAMAQVQRSADRLADRGHDEERSGAAKYLRAALFAIPVGLLVGLGGLVLAAGASVIEGFALEDSAELVWSIVRWPIGIVLVGAGLLLMLRVAPTVPLGTPRHRAAGALVALVVWTILTVLLGVYFAMSTTTTRTYGPLLAVVALVLWSGLTSLALHLGIATTVELERS
ncbi:MAG TPA: YihY/virulence factor BrkB family protein [Actinomycetota bacterium]|nr:YihY/virulence factor BrkB family protein [Actinomycetota bacterium]